MNKNESGNIIIEASIVMTIAGVFILVLINLGMILYQRVLVDTVANDAATQVAHVYALTYRDPFYGYIDESEFYKTELYRYVTNVFTKDLDEKNSRKAEWYGLYRLKKGEVWKGTNPRVKAEIIRKPGTLIQHQVVVTVEATYKIPFTIFWGGENSAEYKAIGKADCIDLLDYFNTVDIVNDFAEDHTKELEFVRKIKKFIDFYDKWNQ
jgi:hypothetical protein